MDPVTAAILGVIQGMTEWLPVSSSGQSVLIMTTLLGIPASDAVSMSFFLHMGTLLAVMLRLRSDVKEVILSLPKWREDRVVRFLVVSTVFTGVVGLPLYVLLKDGFSETWGDYITLLVSGLLVVTGVMLYISRTRFGTRQEDDIEDRDAAGAGAAQGVAVLPGISRSGLTVAALALSGFRMEEALRLSFLMSIPAAAGVLALEFSDMSASVGMTAVAVGCAAAFIVGYVTLDVLIRLAKRVRFDLFCMAFGGVALAFFAVAIFFFQ